MTFLIISIFCTACSWLLLTGLFFLLCFFIEKTNFQKLIDHKAETGEYLYK